MGPATTTSRPAPRPTSADGHRLALLSALQPARHRVSARRRGRRRCSSPGTTRGRAARRLRRLGAPCRVAEPDLAGCAARWTTAARPAVPGYRPGDPADRSGCAAAGCRRAGRRRCSCTPARPPTADATLPGWWPAGAVRRAAARRLVRLARLRRPGAPPACGVFAALAGLAPLHHERLVARGGGRPGRVDPRCTTRPLSYGPQAVDALVRVVGSMRSCRQRPALRRPHRSLGEAAAARHPHHQPRRLLEDACMSVIDTDDTPLRPSQPAAPGPDTPHALPDRDLDRRARALVARSPRPGALGAARRLQRRRAALRVAPPRRRHRRLAALLDPGERHRLARPRHLLGCGGRRPGGSSRTSARSAGGPARRGSTPAAPSASARTTSTGWPAPSRVCVDPRLLPAAVADGQYSITLRCAAPVLGVVRRRAAADRLNRCLGWSR